VDAALAAIIVGNGALGVKRGIFREAFNLVGIAAGLFAGFRLYEALGWDMEGWLGARPEVANVVAFLAVFFGVAFVMSWVGYVLHRGAKKLFVGWLDRGLGGVFGVARGLVFASVAALAVALFPFFPKLEQDLKRSLLGPHVIKVAPATYGFVMEKVRGREYEGLELGTLFDAYLKGEEGPEDTTAADETNTKKGAKVERKTADETHKPYYDRGE